MKQPGGYIYLLLAVACLLLCCRGEAAAQTPRRGAKTLVRGGLMPRPDTLAQKQGVDSLLMIRVDSILRDSTVRDSLLRTGIDPLRLRDSLVSTLRSRIAADSLATAMIDSLRPPGTEAADTLRRHKELHSRRDTLSLSGMSWISLVAPGFGQIYNKQYWKLPILYGTVGAGLALFLYENKKYKPLKKQYDALTLESTSRTPEMDALQTKMIRSNTLRQIYLGATVVSYIYFIGDAAVNYAYGGSPVKKATTLATICPGAGQIYNKSYWKLPFVVGGLATTIYTIDWNNRGYQRYKKAYSIRAAYEKAKENHGKDPSIYPDPGTQSKDEFKGRFPPAFLKNLKDSYRRNRDLCIIITAGIYVLQIVDAHVDAHLKDYDISDDLSLNITPAIGYTYVSSEGGHRPTFGFNLSLNF